MSAERGRVNLPHKITTLVYLFNARGDLLLLERKRKPNAGLWSPIGGKLDAASGESPHECARREVREEIGVSLHPRDLHLAGIVAEHGYEGDHHWLMFLFECKQPLTALPPPHDEGRFDFIPCGRVGELAIPRTDREVIWPLFQQYRGGFFSVKIDCASQDKFSWELEEAWPAPASI
ncbi:MAG: NUDIX domain-containing protein [Verrucomicrobiae bacterium]|nr:NUDIX domain-containing protein [Verrucomicrobiae bacterium]